MAAPLAPSPSPRPDDQPTAAAPRRAAVETVAVAAAAWLWAAWLLRVWDMPKRLPYDTRSDATLISAMVKTMGERGWYLEQPRLGAPFGQHFADFPHGGETFQLLVMKVLVKITGDYGLAINLYFMAGFGVLAAVTFVVLRYLRFGAIPAGIAALIYTFLPYHFAHGEMHLWRSTYATVPVAALLLVWVTSWRERFLVDPVLQGKGSLRGNLRWSRIAMACAMAVLIAGTETMVTAFTLTLLASGAIISAIVWREPMRLAVAGVLIAVIAATFLVLSVPTLDYYRVHGKNDVAGHRLVTESELWGLKLVKLVTPDPHHRSAALAKIGEKAQERTFFTSEGGQAIGILGTAGFLGAVFGAFKRRSKRDDPDTRPPWDRGALDEDATLFTLLSVLFGTVSGFAVLMSMVGFAQVRVWNRILLFIAFFAAVVVLRWSESLTRRVRARSSRPKLVLGAIAVGVLAFGLWDSAPPAHLSYAKIEAQNASDRQFVAEIEAKMPDGASIFQLPVVPFPEAQPVGEMEDYDELRGYLADDGTLQWSYGAFKGRADADWQLRLRDKVGTVGALPALLGLGYQGIWIDTKGYTDKPGQVDQIVKAVGVDPLTSSDGRFVFLDLRPYKERLGLTDEQLRQKTKDLLGIDPPEAGS
ncbi:hypothetical protein [Aquihabitans sp. McL0605]|uniref:hypothetical protein n=1 Tax=Aquihabitans sp. McL0605 TaxID=3415671 RepID=UPI003CE86553